MGPEHCYWCINICCSFHYTDVKFTITGLYTSLYELWGVSKLLLEHYEQAVESKYLLTKYKKYKEFLLVQVVMYQRNMQFK